MARAAARKSAVGEARKSFVRWDDIKQGKMSRQRMKEIDRKLEDKWADLKAIRKIAGKTQAQVGEALTCAQGDVSKIENRDDWKLSTLRRYVQALGGEIEVNAVFGRKKIRLQTR